MASMLSERVKEWQELLKQQGREPGLAQGRVQGEVAVLLRQLDRRLGAGTAERYRARIGGADAATLLGWCERLRTAETPQAVFEPS